MSNGGKEGVHAREAARLPFLHRSPAHPLASPDWWRHGKSMTRRVLAAAVAAAVSANFPSPRAHIWAARQRAGRYGCRNVDGDTCCVGARAHVCFRLHPEEMVREIDIRAPNRRCFFKVKCSSHCDATHCVGRTQVIPPRRGRGHFPAALAAGGRSRRALRWCWFAFHVEEKKHRKFPTELVPECTLRAVTFDWVFAAKDKPASGVANSSIQKRGQKGHRETDQRL